MFGEDFYQSTYDLSIRHSVQGFLVENFLKTFMLLEAGRS